MKIEVYSPTIRRKEMDAVLTSLVEDKIGPGEQARYLIQIAREKIGFDFCIALRSPVFAFYLALKSLGLEQGKGVILSSLSPRYYLNVLEDLKLKPIYADVHYGSKKTPVPGTSIPCMSRETIENALNSKPAEIDAQAIALHHTLGYLPNTAAIADLGIHLIEDCSQSYGSLVNENQAGNKVSRGNALITILGLEEHDVLTAGGGALLYAMNRKDAANLRNLDLPPEYGLPDMNAAMAVVQFRESKRNLEKRREIAGVYAQAALRTRHRYFVQEEPGADSQYNNYAFPLILETGMKDVKTYARRKDVIVENAFEETLMGAGLIPKELCPEAYTLSLRTVLFPLYPRLGNDEVEKVSKLIATLP